MTKNMFAFVSGATHGIGKAVALGLVRNGVKHLAINARTLKDLEATANELRAEQEGLDCLIVPADLSKKEEAFKAASQVLDWCPRLDILVNNTGLYIHGKVLSEAEGNLETMMATNVYSAYHVTRKLIPHLQHDKKSHIFNICSVASLYVYSGGSYTITKYAMRGFNASLREELKSSNVRVTAVYPGPVMSRAWGDYKPTQNELLDAADVAKSIWSAWQLSDNACVEEILIRPQIGDFV